MDATDNREPSAQGLLAILLPGRPQAVQGLTQTAVVLARASGVRHRFLTQTDSDGLSCAPRWQAWTLGLGRLPRVLSGTQYLTARSTQSNEPAPPYLPASGVSDREAVVLAGEVAARNTARPLCSSVTPTQPCTQPKGPSSALAGCCEPGAAA